MIFFFVLFCFYYFIFFIKNLGLLYFFLVSKYETASTSNNVAHTSDQKIYIYFENFINQSPY